MDVMKVYPFRNIPGKPWRAAMKRAKREGFRSIREALIAMVVGYAEGRINIRTVAEDSPPHPK